LRTLPPDPDARPPVVDLELAGTCSDRPDRAWIERQLGAFVEQVESTTSQTVVLYVGDDFEGRYDIRDELDRPIWHRRVLIRPDVDGWWIWQVHGYASVDGIDGDADLNVMRGDDPTDVPAGPRYLSGPAHHMQSRVITIPLDATPRTVGQGCCRTGVWWHGM